jgi:hypothetical protein
MQIELTGVIAEMYSVTTSSGLDTQIVIETLPTVTITAVDTNGNCTPYTADTVAFCSKANFPGACNCSNIVKASGYAVIDTITQTIRKLSVSWDSSFFYGRTWNTYADLELGEIGYTESTDGSSRADFDLSTVSSKISKIAYRQDHESTAAGASTWKWTKQITGFAPGAKLQITINK